MTKPLLTVCVITYNHVKYIEEAIDSILAQEVDFSWKLVIADDFSTDGTKEILERYKAKYPELIDLILQKSNVGPESNWLDLMSYPTSKYVLYAEGDDYLTDPKKLQKQVDFLEHHKDYSICFHPVKVIYEDSSYPDEIFPTSEFRHNKDVLELKDLLQNNFIQTNSAMYRWRFTDEKIKTAFPKSISPGDWYLHIIHAELGEIGFIDSVMSAYRRHNAGLWWDAGNNKGLFWEKQAIPHARLYEHLLDSFGDNAELRNPIELHIDEAIEGVALVSSPGRERILQEIFDKFPTFIPGYITRASKRLSKLENDINYILKVKSDEKAMYDKTVALLEADNKRFKKSLTHKVEQKVRRDLKRIRKVQK